MQQKQGQPDGHSTNRNPTLPGEYDALYDLRQFSKYEILLLRTHARKSVSIGITRDKTNKPNETNMPPCTAGSSCTGTFPRALRACTRSWAGPAATGRRRSASCTTAKSQPVFWHFWRRNPNLSQVCLLLQGQGVRATSRRAEHAVLGVVIVFVSFA